MQDDIYDAMKTVVKALGGCSAVGKRMRPQLPADKAERWLADAINRNRHQKPDPEQIMLLARWGREAGCHALMEFFCLDAGYEPTKPRALAEQLAALITQANTARLNAEAAAHDLAVLEQNPRLLSMMKAANLKVGA